MDMKTVILCAAIACGCASTRPTTHTYDACIKGHMGTSPSHLDENGSVRVTPVAMADIQPSDIRVVKGSFAACLPNGRYTFVGSAQDGRTGGTDVDVDGADIDTFIYTGQAMFPSERLSDCVLSAQRPSNRGPLNCDRVNAQPSACRIDGTIADAAGAPVPYARVTVVVDRGACVGSTEHREDGASLVTDKLGQYRVAHLACAGAYIVSFFDDTCVAEYVGFDDGDARTVNLKNQ